MSPHPDGTSCEAVLDALERFVDHETSDSETRAIERHVATCAPCARELSLAREIRAELRALPRREAPAAVVEAVKRTARYHGRSAARARWRTFRPSPLWAMAAALIMAAVLTPVVWGPPPKEIAAIESPSDTHGAGQFDPAEIERATEEVRVALAYVGRATRKTGLEIRDGLILERLIRPAAESLSTRRDAPAGTVGRQRDEI